MIYLASPYTHQDPAVRAERTRRVTEAFITLRRRGHPIISPIAAFAPLAELHGLAGDAAAWWDINRKLLEASEELWLLPLADWQASAGVRQEIDYMLSLKRPCYRLDAGLNCAPMEPLK